MADNGNAKRKPRGRMVRRRRRKKNIVSSESRDDIFAEESDDGHERSEVTDKVYFTPL